MLWHAGGNTPGFWNCAIRGQLPASSLLACHGGDGVGCLRCSFSSGAKTCPPFCCRNILMWIRSEYGKGFLWISPLWVSIGFPWISNTCSGIRDFESSLPRRMLAAQESTDEILHDLDSMVRAVTWPKMLEIVRTFGLYMSISRPSRSDFDSWNTKTMFQQHVKFRKSINWVTKPLIFFHFQVDLEHRT